MMVVLHYPVISHNVFVCFMDAFQYVHQVFSGTFVECNGYVWGIVRIVQLNDMYFDAIMLFNCIIFAVIIPDGYIFSSGQITAVRNGESGAHISSSL